MRILKRDYQRYNQILRIEAGVSQYDWLVQNYRERQAYIHDIGETSGSGSVNGTTSGSLSRTTGGTTTTNHTGTVTDKTDFGKVIDNTGTVKNEQTRTPNITENIVKDYEKTTNGGYTDTQKDGRTITDTRDTQTIGGDDSTQKSTSWNTINHKELAKANPMSIEYGSGIVEPTPSASAEDAGATSGGTLSWASPSSQSAQMGLDHSGQVVTDHQGHIQDQTTHTVTGGDLETTRDYDDLKDEIDDTTTKTTTGTEKNDATRTDNLKQTNSGSDTATKTLNTTDATTNSGTITDMTGGTTSQTTTTTGGSENEGLVQEIYTGRNDDPATILKKAAQYILTTDAFEWLTRRLDICFLGVYDI